MGWALQQISAFGLEHYLSKRLYARSPEWGKWMMRRGQGFTRTAYGVLMAENWSDQAFRLAAFGGAGLDLFQLLARRNRPFAFIDIGANQGLFSLIALKNRHCRAVLAFEPVPSTFAILQQNIARSKQGHRIAAKMKGISHEAGPEEMVVLQGNSGAASLYGVPGPKARPVKVEMIRAVEMVPMIEGGVDLVVKIEVEGHEAYVLRDLLESPLAARIDTLFCGVDQRLTALDQIRAMLVAAGFGEIHQIGEGGRVKLCATR